MPQCLDHHHHDYNISQNTKQWRQDVMPTIGTFCLHNKIGDPEKRPFNYPDDLFSNEQQVVVKNIEQYWNVQLYVVGRKINPATREIKKLARSVVRIRRKKGIKWVSWATTPAVAPCQVGGEMKTTPGKNENMCWQTTHCTTCVCIVCTHHLWSA